MKDSVQSPTDRVERGDEYTIARFGREVLSR